MGWNKRFINKVKTIAALGLVFLLVIATNMMDNHHFDVVRKTLKTVYEDRLVAKEYIYKMSGQIRHKQLALLKGEDVYAETRAANDSLQVLTDLYATTKLTSREAGQFRELQRNLQELSQFESRWMEEGAPANLSEVEGLYSKIENNLATLAQIQVQEGKRQIDYSNRAIANSDLISTIEIGVLIVIGLIVQILIIYNPSPRVSRGKAPQPKTDISGV